MNCRCFGGRRLGVNYELRIRNYEWFACEGYLEFWVGGR